MIINNEEAYELIGQDQELIKLCKKCIIECADCKFTFALTNLPDVNLQFKASPFIKILKDANNLFLFRQMGDIKLYDPDIRTKKKYVRPLGPNEMYFKCGSYFAKYKVPK